MPSPLLALRNLDLLRGFVAVGRRMSITAAAEDLCLTQSAVSRQVRALEEALGVALLVRRHRAIEFTPEGERLFRAADAALEQILAVLASVAEARVAQPVTVTASIGAAALWLLPRLGRLHAQHPDIDLRVAAGNRVIADLKLDGIDLAIRYCDAEAAPPGALRLFGETIAPVAHPALAHADIGSRGGLAEVTLLEFEDPRTPWLHWERWLSEHNLAGAKPRAWQRYNQYDLVVQAALAGQGIALGRLGLLQDRLLEGRLVVLAEPVEPAGSRHAYWLLRADASPRPAVRAVAEWIAAEAAAGR